ncbi:MFS transporter [Amorphus orientalis]|uniref:MFS family permease n=1 Tax=Amorphus orientalis TaxID=649198 RepID=A0AAE3VPW1_9HYPH|nr:MFS transporter [Amorphus orientalis]MDQ0316043.1 MFS family permease [Amorphus orientalis]
MTSPTAEAHFVDDRLARRNAFLLAAAQALGGAITSITIATGGLTGFYLLGPDKSLATLPVTTMVLGTACGTVPAALLMRRIGRRPGFMIGSLVGAAGGIAACLAILYGSFLLFALATWFTGLSTAFVQQYRFAATDTASAVFRPKAISWVLAGGILAGVIGPQTVIWTRDLFSPIQFAGAFLAQAGLCLIAMTILAFVSIPKPKISDDRTKGRPLTQILSETRIAIAVLCGVVSYALMSLVMTAAPLAMVQCGLSADNAALGIQWHVIAMFAPSFFTGNLIARFGRETITAIGLALLATSGIVALTGLTLGHFWLALILLGLGWNFGFIGATAMLTDAHRPEERARVQAANDLCVFGFVAIASFSSGKILNVAGWGMVNWALFPVIALALAALSWLVLTGRHRTA